MAVRATYYYQEQSVSVLVTMAPPQPSGRAKISKRLTNGLGRSTPPSRTWSPRQAEKRHAESIKTFKMITSNTDYIMFFKNKVMFLCRKSIYPQTLRHLKQSLCFWSRISFQRLFLNNNTTPFRPQNLLQWDTLKKLTILRTLKHNRRALRSSAKLQI